jgi:hypothetical protein
LLLLSFRRYSACASRYALNNLYSTMPSAADTDCCCCCCCPAVAAAAAAAAVSGCLPGEGGEEPVGSADCAAADVVALSAASAARARSSSAIASLVETAVVTAAQAAEVVCWPRTTKRCQTKHTTVHQHCDPAVQYCAFACFKAGRCPSPPRQHPLPLTVQASPPDARQAVSAPAAAATARAAASS